MPTITSISEAILKISEDKIGKDFVRHVWEEQFPSYTKACVESLGKGINEELTPVEALAVHGYMDNMVSMIHVASCHNGLADKVVGLEECLHVTAKGLELTAKLNNNFHERIKTLEGKIRVL